MWIVIIVIVIIVVITMKKEDKVKAQSTHSSTQLNWYYKEIDDLIKKCYDEKTRRFNGDLYFSERDKYIYSGIPQVVKHLEDELKAVGRLQITYINYYLLYPAIQSGDYQAMPAELQRMHDILLELLWICGGGNDNDCPSNIVAYRQLLFDIMYKKVICNQALVQKALDLVKNI